MLYTIHQLLFVSLLIGIASAIIVWLISRSRTLRLFRRQRAEIDAILAWRAVEHENALIAANESLRVSNDQRREAEQRLTELNQRIGQYDDTIANLHRNLRNHQEKLRDAQRRADAGDEAVVGERRAREFAELRLGDVKSTLETLEGEVIELKTMVRGSNNEAMSTLERQVRALSEAKRELEVRLETSQAAVGDRVALERRLVETQERLRAAEGELSGARSELTRARVAHQAKSSVLEGRVRDYEQELEFAEARIDAMAAEQAEVHKQELDAIQCRLSEAHRQLQSGRRRIEERDEEIDRLREELEELRAVAVGHSDVEATLRERVSEAEAEVKGLEASLAKAKTEAESAAAELVAAKQQAGSAEAELAAAQIENAAFEVGLSENEEELGGLRSAAQQLRSELVAAMEIAEDRQAEVEGLRVELAAARAAADAESSKDARLAEQAEAAVLRLEDELDSARVEILNLQRLRSAEDEELREALEEELSELRVRVAELEAAAVAREELAQIEAGIHRQQHASMEQALVSAIDDLSAERERSQTMADQLQAAELKAARVDEETQEEHDRREAVHAAEVEAIKARLEAADGRLEEVGIIAREDVSARDDELAEWRTRVEAYEAQLRQANAQMAEQMGVLVELERSLSAAEAAQREAAEAAAAASEEAAAASEEAAVKSAMLAEAERQRDTLSAQVDELIAARPTASPGDSGLLTALESERHELETRVEAMAEALHEASRVAAEASAVAEEELAELRGQLGELARQLSARDAELAVAVREMDEQRARAEALEVEPATAEPVKETELVVEGQEELVAGLREQLRAQEEALKSLRAELQRANHRIQAVAQLSEQVLDPEAPDDLKLIAGVGPVLESRLREAGFHSYRDLALLDDESLEVLSGPMGSLRNRIRREHWAVQAKTLHLAKHGEQL